MPHDISTHAPRTGSDPSAATPRPKKRNFNPRSPHGERRRGGSGSASTRRFQPTLPARGATYSRKTLNFWTAHFNPRSPHGERLQKVCPIDLDAEISTHAPRTGSDRARIAAAKKEGKISTHAPRTGSDARYQRAIIRRNISTHAPRTGSDCCGWFRKDLSQDFNPRSPHGERRKGYLIYPGCIKISTHAPRTGSD